MDYYTTDKTFRKLINLKKHDLTTKDIIVKQLINNDPWCSMYIIKYNCCKNILYLYDNSSKDVYKINLKIYENIYDSEPYNNVKNVNIYFNNNYITTDFIQNNDRWIIKYDDDDTTSYKINDGILECERTISEKPTTTTFDSFRKFTENIAKQCTNCKKYLLLIKNTDGETLMNELHDVDD